MFSDQNAKMTTAATMTNFVRLMVSSQNQTVSFSSCIVPQPPPEMLLSQPP